MTARSDSKRPFRLGPLLIGLILTVALPTAVAGQPQTLDRITVTGQLHCVDRLGRAEEATDDCQEQGKRYALKDDDGRLFFFSQSDPRAGIFEDPRVRPRRLQITGRPQPDRFLEIVHLHSIESDGLHRLYYRCDVCNITAYAPGPCWCCREDFEFRSELETDSALTRETPDDSKP